MKTAAKENERKSLYASDEWVEQVLRNDTLTREDHERIASDLGRCGHLRALCRLHIGLCRKEKQQDEAEYRRYRANYLAGRIQEENDNTAS